MGESSGTEARRSRLTVVVAHSDLASFYDPSHDMRDEERGVGHWSVTAHRLARKLFCPNFGQTGCEMNAFHGIMGGEFRLNRPQFGQIPLRPKEGAGGSSPSEAAKNFEGDLGSNLVRILESPGQK